VASAVASDDPPKYKRCEQQTNPDLAPFTKQIRETLLEKKFRGSSIPRTAQARV